MPPLTADPDELTLLREGRAAIPLLGHRLVQVRGADARRWLHDLVTADVAHLDDGDALRTLLLDATGHIRADVQVVAHPDGFWLVQPPEQPHPVARSLAPFVLSSDVELVERDDLVPISLPGPDDDAGVPAPSSGPGIDVLAAVDAIDPPAGRTWVGPDAVEVRRIRSGDPRMTVDFDETAIPATAGLEALIDLEKGCFLGQESVARVRNLGHPPAVIHHMRCDAQIEPGQPLLTSEQREDAGRVTSSASDGADGIVVLATVRWSAATSLLCSADGDAMVPVGSVD
jgi:tRNA-modifying protein YgfZ